MKLTEQDIKELEDAIAPFAGEIKNFGKTPGQAVDRLFAWSDALAKNPDEAFPALMKAFKWNHEKVLKPKPSIWTSIKNVLPWVKQAEELRDLKQQIELQFTDLAKHFSEQSAAKTQDMLDNWAKDKPHFEAVRVMMGYLLTPDEKLSEPLIPLKDGKVDLDAAYTAACWAVPEIRQKLLDEKAQKDKIE